jgi:hypothetical protein
LLSTDAGDSALAARLAGHRVLLCYGLFGDLMAALRPIGLDYMAGQLLWLRRIGVEAAPVPLPSAAPVARNAARIAEAVLAKPSPVLLLAHSKGGIEALSALLVAPEVAARCRGFLALQSPFRGSPLADAALGLAPLRLAADRVLRLVRLGEGQGLLDLTCAIRTPWMDAHAAAIEALAARLPMASLATVVGEGGSWRDRPYLPLARWMERIGAGPNDGLVPVASTRLPGARHAVVPGGHRALVAAGPGRDPVGLLRRELPLLLDGEAIPSPPPPAPAPHPPSP